MIPDMSVGSIAELTIVNSITSNCTAVSLTLTRHKYSNQSSGKCTIFIHLFLVSHNTKSYFNIVCAINILLSY